MRILIVTAGSRGDVAPFAGLGQRLQQAGHQVALAAHARFAGLVREAGLEYRALPGDAGAGTTGAGLRAGVPAVPVPFLVDQPFWAERLHRLGVAPPPLPVGELTADALAAAIRPCLERPSYRAQAAHLAQRIGAEDGSGAVRSLVTRLGGTG